MLDEGIDNLTGYDACQAVTNTCLAFYGPSLVASGASWQLTFEQVLVHFAQFDCPPTHMGSDALNTDRILSFDRSEKKFRITGMNATKFGLFSFPQGLERRRYAEDAGAFVDANTFVLGFRSALLPEKGASLIETAKVFSRLLQPVYGIIYEIPLAFGPTEYGYGLRLNSGRAVQDWGMGVLRFHLFHFLRNVYEWNFLTDLQLGAKIGNSSLADWIQSDSRRGTLAKFDETMTLWSVEPDQIASLRQVLDESGALYSYERHMLPIIEKYRCSEAEAAERLKRMALE